MDVRYHEGVVNAAAAFAPERALVKVDSPVGHDVRPGYLHGLAATVIRRGTETITIQLDRPVGKYVDGCIRCSPLAVDKIGT